MLVSLYVIEKYCSPDNNLYVHFIFFCLDHFHYTLHSLLHGQYHSADNFVFIIAPRRAINLALHIEESLISDDLAVAGR